jgi:molybdopterin molybdotransferase
LELWNIAIKPGKPLAFGHLGDTPFIGLPGNPVSMFITFCLYARPFLLLTQGENYQALRFMWVRAGFSRPRGHKRREYLRARIITDTQGREVAQPYAHQGSGVLSSLAWAEGLVCIPEHDTVQSGDMVRYLPLAQLID